MTTQIRVLGAARSVSGSQYHLASGDTHLLIDCGLFDGYKHARLRNWRPLPLDPEAIDAVLLTQARSDHIGLLPRLVREGMQAPAYATAATRDLGRLLLAGRGRNEEEYAAFAAEEGFSRHPRPEPLYTEAEGLAAADRIAALPTDEPMDVETMQVQFQASGNIPGAASILIQTPESSVLFSGDIGRSDDPLMPAPAPRPAADHIVMEATYGDHRHDATDADDHLRRILEAAADQDGIVLIPAAAVGRTQSVLQRLAAIGNDLPVHVDSPFARGATQALCDHPEAHRLDADACLALCDTANFYDEPAGDLLDDIEGPAIIIAASEMATRGRILHHIHRHASDPRNTLVLMGHQAPGTRGYAILQGANAVKIHGEWVSIEARIEAMPEASTHADRDGLLDWLGQGPTPRSVILTHGEAGACDALRVHIEDRFGCHVHVPDLDDELRLG